MSRRPSPALASRLAGGLAALLVVAALGAIPPAASAAADRLPDLRMAKLTDFRIVYSGSRRLLRFSSTMTNLGQGAFEIRSSRASSSSPWDVDQVIFDAAGGSRRVDTTAAMQYGGDGHGHWHVNGMVEVDLWSATRHARGAKIGYCFFDTTAVALSLAGAPGKPVYRETMCARQTGLASRVGISVGWGDRYQSTLPFQWVDITGLPGGEYRIRAIVDARNRFLESSDANNCTHARIRFNSSGTAVTVLGSGSACTNDYVGTSLEAEGRWAFQNGLPGCGVNLLCPMDRVTRGELATWLARAFDLPAATGDYYTDDESSPYEADINRLAEAGLATDCGAGTYCPTRFASRGELAASLAAGLTVPGTRADYFSDDETSPHERSINALTQAGIATSCGPGLYCPWAAVTRGALAGFVYRALG